VSSLIRSETEENRRLENAEMEDKAAEEEAASQCQVLWKSSQWHNCCFSYNNFRYATELPERHLQLIIINCLFPGRKIFPQNR